MTTDAKEPGILQKLSAHQWRWMRISAVFGLLAMYAVAAIWFYRECSVTRTQDIAGKLAVESVCAPPAATSATLLILLLLAVALIWPDISEVTVLGVALKRRVEEAKATALEAKEGVAQLGVSLQIQQSRIDAAVAASATANVTNTNNTYYSDNWGSRESERLKQQFEKFSSSPTNMRARRHEREGLSEMSVAELKVTFLSEFERLAEMLELYPTRASKWPHPDRRGQSWIEQDFADEHASAIRATRTLRDAIAHARDVPGEDVQEGLALVRSLTRLVQDRTVG